MLLVKTLDLPFSLIGDFNCILNAKDKIGGKHFHVHWEIKEFCTFLGHSICWILATRVSLLLGIITNRLGLARLRKRLD